MVNESTLYAYCIGDFSLIENYEKAISDITQTWHCHHRKETDEGLSKHELLEQNLYYHRPPEELIFLTSSEHTKIHNKYYHVWRGKHPWNYSKKNCYSEEHIQNIINSNKNRILSEETIEKKRNSMLGKNKGPRSEETKQKISNTLKGKYTGEKNHLFGKHLSEEHKQKLREVNIGKHHSEETKKKIQETLKGKQPWNKGLKGCFSEETIKKRSDSHRGKSLSEETKNKISLSIKKYWENKRNGK